MNKQEALLFHEFLVISNSENQEYKGIRSMIPREDFDEFREKNIVRGTGKVGGVTKLWGNLIETGAHTIDSLFPPSMVVAAKRLSTESKYLYSYRVVRLEGKWLSVYVKGG